MREIGVKKVRLTGGEPTLRRDFIDILKLMADVEGLQTIALTTNGYSLYKHAKAYQEAGLTNITISLDSLTPNRFHHITQMTNFPHVLKGIEACVDNHFPTIKINAVLLKGMNDTPHEINQFFDYVLDKPITIRFIELMKTKDNETLFKNHFSSTQVLLEKLKQEGWRQIKKSITAGPAREYEHPDYLGKIGIISPYSSIFCADCNRVRISSKGELYVCLFNKNNTPLRDLLLHPSQKTDLIQRIQNAYTHKKISHFLHDGEGGRDKHFSSIGG